MRQALWDALRRGDVPLAEKNLSEEVRSLGGWDEHLLVTATELQHSFGSGLQVASSALEPPMKRLQGVCQDFCAQRWEAVVSAGAQLLDSAGDERERFSPVGAGFACWYAMRAAQHLKDLQLSASLSKRAVATYGENATVLIEALQIEAGYPHLDCPDHVLLDLAKYTASSAGESFLDSAWPTVVTAVCGWLSLRDGNMNEARQSASHLTSLLQGYPYDVTWALPFMKGVQATQLAQVVKGLVPATHPVFLLAHLVYACPSDEEKRRLTESLLTRYPDDHRLLYEKARLLAHTQYADSAAICKRLLDSHPKHSGALRILIRTGALQQDDSETLRSAKQYISTSDERWLRFQGAATVLKEHKRPHVLAELASYFLDQTEYRRRLEDAQLSALLEHFDSRRDHEVLHRWLSAECETRSPEELGTILAQPATRRVLREWPDIGSLPAASRLAFVHAAIQMKDYALVEKVLPEDLDGQLGEQAATQFGDRVRQFARARRAFTPTAFTSTDLKDLLNLASNVSLKAYQDVCSDVVIAMRKQAQFLPLRVALTAYVQQWPKPKVLEYSAKQFREALNDISGALSLLDEHWDWAKADPTVWRLRCSLLDSAVRVEDWLEAAATGAESFPDDGRLDIEKGLALLAHGESEQGISELIGGLTKSPADARGLTKLAEIAAKFRKTDALLLRLEAAINAEPDEFRWRDMLITALDRLEGHERELIQHIYDHVHKHNLSQLKERDKQLKARICSVRRRLVIQDVGASPALGGHAVSNRERVLKALEELPATVRSVISAAVFAELPAPEAEGDTAQEAKGTQQEKPKRTHLGLRVLVQPSAEDAQSLNDLAGEIRNALRSHSYPASVDCITAAQLWRDLRGSRRSELELLLEGIPVRDFPFLANLRMIDDHRRRVVEKFSDYVVCYVVAGSFVRGIQRPESDIDAWIVIDDGDARAMGHTELDEKIRAIGRGMGSEARDQHGALRPLHLQTYLLSDFWLALRDAQPIYISFLREGVPLYDRGMSTSWCRILDQHRLHATREALDHQFQAVEAHRSNANTNIRKLCAALIDPLKYCTVKTLEALEAFLRLPIGGYREVIDVAERELAQNRDLLNSDDIALARRVVDVVKAAEQGSPGNVEELLQLHRDVERFADKGRRVFHRLRADRDIEILRDLVQRIDRIMHARETSAPQRDIPDLEALAAFREDAESALETQREDEWAVLHIASLGSRIDSVARRVIAAEQELSIGDARND